MLKLRFYFKLYIVWNLKKFSRKTRYLREEKPNYSNLENETSLANEGTEEADTVVTIRTKHT